MNKAVFLDRDGTINNAVVVDGKPLGPRSLDQLSIPMENRKHLDLLRDAGYKLIVITNQPDIANGLLTWDSLNAVNERITKELAIDEFVICAHRSQDNCDCRKPKPGMIFDSAAKWDIDLAQSWTIGDRWVDIAAGRRAQVATILLRQPWSWQPTSSGSPPEDLQADFEVTDLAGAVNIILST